MRKRAALGLLREGRWGAVVIMALSGSEGVIAILEGRRAAIVSSIEALDASYTGQRWATVFLASAEYYAACAAETDPSARLACLELRC